MFEDRGVVSDAAQQANDLRNLARVRYRGPRRLAEYPPHSVRRGVLSPSATCHTPGCPHQTASKRGASRPPFRDLENEL
jgi:hypothetical protein